jgi:fibrillarin-like rRNA methylase
MTGYDYFEKQGSPVIMINTTSLDVGQATREVLTQILDKFEQKFD